MRIGDDINGYRVVSEPTNSGGGRCVWAFAERQDHPYFIKQFLDPKWPTEASMGSPASKERRREECREFERRHREVNKKINPRAIGGGNLVTAIDFFRQETAYYKVTDRVDAVAAADLRKLSTRQTVVVLRTLCHSIRLLHRAGIVHGDLKPGNVLLQRSTTSDLFTAKVIDFDDSYPSGDPPPPDQVVGDQQYGAPEWLRYVKRDSGVTGDQLTTAADIFALGLVFHVYLTGALPAYDEARFGAPAEAVWSGQPLDLSPTLHPATRAMIARMAAASVAVRPTVDDLLTLLADDAVVVSRTPTAPELHPPTPRGSGSSRIRHTFDPPRDDPPHRPATPPADRGSRIRKNFGR